MINGARSEPAMQRAIAQRWVIPRKKWGEERLLRAAADGEATGELDISAALDLLYGPLYARLLMRGSVPTEDETRAHFALICRAIFVR
jgi:hypothetical protein